MLGTASCSAGSPGSASGVSKSAPQSADTKSGPAEISGPEEQANAGPESPQVTGADRTEAETKAEKAPADPMARFTAPDTSGLQGALQGRAAVSDFINGTPPGNPGEGQPGAVFSKEQYKKLATLANAEFIALRTRIMNSKDRDEPTVRLQRSFFSNGCTSVPQAITPETAWKACAQHDFRYTAGPNLFKDDKSSQDADRTEADTQLGTNIGGLAGRFVAAAVDFAGSFFYTATDSAGSGEETDRALLKFSVSG
ncbi:hypothetical protein [Streptomyces sp. SAS_270]|uniref:hypothetical protein n=1 Tax=Streptomyces sp. SAS_270 TaxID=3412748 RepID=UPI00403CBEB5